MRVISEAMTKEEIGIRLRHHRESNPYVTLKELSEETRVLSFNRISNYEQGIRSLKPNEAKVLADAFTKLGKPTTVTYLLGIDSIKSEDKPARKLSVKFMLLQIAKELIELANLMESKERKNKRHKR